MSSRSNSTMKQPTSPTTRSRDNMPYNTRRKSLSLPSLGIHVPQSSRASAVTRSPPSASTLAATGSHPSARPPPSQQSPPSKKVKRSHASLSPTTPSTPSGRRPGRPKSSSLSYHHTPPPSPPLLPTVRIDTDGISDEIVTAVIKQLEQTGNKPQLVKELAAVLCDSLDVVESSANPQAIITSRLNAYLKRPWTALSPCPVAKTLLPSHPRRIYFYLTTTPHQPLPIPSSESPLASNRRSAVISPSLTSDEDEEARRRAALSPSPEIDLSTPELDHDDNTPPTPSGTFSGRSSLARDGTHSAAAANSLGRSSRAPSPPLEGDEREFTHTASMMQSKRSLGLTNGMPYEGDFVRTTTEGENGEVPTAAPAPEEETEEHAEQRSTEAAAALFGHAQPTPTATLSSPVTKPDTNGPSQAKRQSLPRLDMMEIEEKSSGDTPFMSMGWAAEMISPENVELEELDDLLGSFC